MKFIICSFAIAAALVGCSKQETPKAAAPDQTKAAPVTAASAAAPAAQMPTGHPAVPPGATGGSIGENLAPAAQEKLTGTVTETMNSGGYTYILVKNAAGEQWAAVQQTTAKKGQNVTIFPEMTAENFESASLGRKFDRIVFGTMSDSGAPTPAAPVAMAAMMAGAAQHMKANAAAVGDVNVPKAEGTNAKTVAEVWSERPAIKGASITVRAKVVKFLPAIMGKNWMHLRDGSGSAEKGDNDLTLTTTDVAKVGDVVVVSGKVSVDKDFGAGYSYPVILEDAQISK